MTRPRPSIGPAWPVRSTCPVSSSELSRTLRRRGPPGQQRHRRRAGRGSPRSPRPTSKPKCWSGPTRCPSWCCCGRRAARPASQLARHAVRPGRRRQRQVVAGDGQRRRGAQGGPDIRCRGGPDRGGFGRRAAGLELPRRAARRSVAPLAGLAAFGDGRKAKGRNRFRGSRGSRSGAGPGPPATRGRRLRRGQAVVSGDPGRRSGQRRGEGARSGRSNSSRAQPRNARMLLPSPTPRRATSKPRSRPPMCKSSTRM